MHRRSDATASPDQGTRASLEVPGRVVEALPNALFRVEIEGERRQMVTAHVSGGSSLLRLLPGEIVVVELMAYDTTRGRIVRRKS